LTEEASFSGLLSVAFAVPRWRLLSGDAVAEAAMASNIRTIFMPFTI
jgi:hypothetical protein